MTDETTTKTHDYTGGDDLWERLARAEVHPLRLRALERLRAAAEPMSPSGLSREFDLPLGNVDYHVNQLAKKGFIELSHTEKRRGATEHFFRVPLKPAGAKKQKAAA